MRGVLASLVLLTGTVLGATYRQTDSHAGSSFINGFNYEAIGDPTHGRVNYVNAATAQSQNLTWGSGETFILRADNKKKLSASGPGRDSVRLISKKQYGSNTVMVFNIWHMPVGCGTWPAVWTVGGNWPNQGEIDILEGVNDVGPNQATLHTNSGCTMPSSRSQTGTSVGNNCDVAATGNAGCGVKINEPNSYARSFNSIGGGWYAMERTDSFIKVWYWPRNANNVPSDVRSGSSSINTGNWGTPSANFPNNSCPITSKFGAHNIVINLTFCGDWAGAVYGSSGCPGSCVDYVNNNPGAFNEAHFDFQWIKVYGL